MHLIPASGLRGLSLREAAPDLMRTINAVRAALDAKINSAGPGSDRKWFDLEAVYPESAVICLDGHTWSYGYTISGNDVTLTDPVEVMETYVPMKEAAPASDAALRLVEADGVPVGTVWEATIIQAGISLNNVLYTDAMLREAAPMFDGVRIRLVGDVQHLRGGNPDLRDVVGWGEKPRFVEGATPDTGRIVGTLNLPGLPEHTRALLVGAIAAGKQDIAGLSIDAQGKGTTRMVEGKKVRVPSAITKVVSVDLIVEPGAGGRLIRLVEAAPTTPHQGDSDMSLREKMLRFVEAKNPAAYAKIDAATISDDDLERAYREAAAAVDKISQVEERLRMIEARAAGNALIAESNLPKPAKERLRRVLDERERFVEADVTALINEEREYLGRMAESGRVQLDFIRTEDRSKKLADMLDAFFDQGHKDHRGTQSFKECYIEMTGDKRVTGQLRDCDPIRLRECAGELALREAAIDSTTFSLVLGDAIQRRMLADYNLQSQLDAWRLIANVVPLSDFRTNHRTLYGGFGDLPDVAEGGDYQVGGVPDDDEATYKPGKKGRLFEVTMEAVRNDDVGLIRDLPLKMSRAAKRTLSKFVLDFLRTNAAIADGKALFHADHGNLGTAALSASAWSAMRLAMMQQTEAGSGERLNIPPKYLLVPAELEEQAYEMFKQRGTNQDQSFIQTTAPTIVPVWYWTDANDYVGAADKADIAGLEVGFLDGREEPEVFVQDMPNVGSLFSSDMITYKIRHIYGGAIMNYRAFRKNVVA